MKRILMLVLGSAIAMTFVAAAVAQMGDPANGAKNTPPAPSASTKAPESMQPEATPPPDAGATQKDQPTPAVSGSATMEQSAAAKSNPAIDRVKERGLKASAKERADVDKKLDEIEKQVENEATAKGEAAVAGRIAGEFSVTADALTAERNQFNRGWGEILVAHTLLANAKTDATIADIFQMRNQGMGWGVIAAGLNLKLGEVVPAVKSEGRVATGLAKGDGKAARIHTASASLGAGAKVHGKASGAKGGVSAAGAGVGAGVDLNKGTGK